MDGVLSRTLLSGTLSLAVTYLLLSLSSDLSSDPEFGKFINAVFLPAGAFVLFPVAFGVIGILGVGLATFMWEIMSEARSGGQAQLIALARILVSTIILFAARYLLPWRSGSDWSGVRVEHLAMVVIFYAVTNAGIHHALFLSGEFGFAPSPNSFVKMMIGDMLGALLFFFCANVATSLVLRLVRR